MADDAAAGPVAESEAGDAETDADTIAARTRTKLSLVDVPIDTLEASLPDAALNHVRISPSFWRQQIQTQMAIFRVGAKNSARMTHKLMRVCGACRARALI